MDRGGAVRSTRTGYRCVLASVAAHPGSALYGIVVSGMAKVLLEHVVHGDELDVIWTGLNADDDPGPVGADDDEEQEAQRLHPVDDDMD